jgi:hypothetical protein
METKTADETTPQRTEATEATAGATTDKAPDDTRPEATDDRTDGGADDSTDDSTEAGGDGGTDGVTAADAGPQAGTEAAGKVPSGVGQGAGAVVSAALGLVSLSGSWLGTVAGAREQLVGQLRTSSSASVSTQLKEVYGDAWQTTALWGGLFALASLIVAVVVLARAAFGTPGGSQVPWIKSVAWAGVVLGVTGLLLAVLKYSDALLGLPSA